MHAGQTETVINIVPKDKMRSFFKFIVYSSLNTRWFYSNVISSTNRNLSVQSKEIETDMISYPIFS